MTDMVLGCIVWPVLLIVAGMLWFVPYVGPVLSLCVVGGGFWLSAKWPTTEYSQVESARLTITGTRGEPLKVMTTNPDTTRIVDLRALETMRLRIVGTGYYISFDERRRYGGPDYLLVLEPDNPADPLAVAVYGKGRKVGHLSAKRAAMLHPFLAQMDAEAFRVSGSGCTDGSSVLYVDLPRIPALRAFAKGQAG